MTVLVKYRAVIEAPHALLNDTIIEKSTVVNCFNLTELNSMFENITDIKILEK